MKYAQFFISAICVLAGIALVFVALYTPPAGQIDASVLVAYGETLTFAGAVIGVDYRYRFGNNKPRNINSKKQQL